VPARPGTSSDTFRFANSAEEIIVYRNERSQISGGFKAMEEKPYETVNTPPAQVPPPTYSAPVATPGGLTENSAAALSYVTIIPAIIFLVIEPYNKMPFVRFHAFQCIAFAVVLTVIHIVLLFIPIVGWILSALVTLASFVIWLITILKASKGEWFKLPIIGDFAMSQSKL
jgi:uncharacterized membrane protein